MDNFNSFSEDSLPRSAPRPTIDIASCSAKDLSKPIVPEVSFLNLQLAATTQSTIGKKSTTLPSYKDWKKENIVPPSNAPERKQVTFQTFPSESVVPQSIQIHKNTSNKHQEEAQHQYDHQEALFNTIANRKRLNFQNTEQLCSGSTSPNEIISSHFKINETKTEPTITDVFHIFLKHYQELFHQQPSSSITKHDNIAELLRLLSVNTSETKKSLNTAVENTIVDEQHNFTNLYRMIVNTEDPLSKVKTLTELQGGSNIPAQSLHQTEKAPDLTINDLYQIILKQQKQITILQQQVKELALQNKENQLSSHLNRSNKTELRNPTIPQLSDSDEMALGEEASNTQPLSPSKNNQSQRSPADWAFYGNTLEQVIDVLQNSPTSQLQAPTTIDQQKNNNKRQMQKVFQVSHIQGHNFTDVNVSATQRVTFDTPIAQQQYRYQISNGENSSPLSITDRSLAMNSLALKYLPIDKLQNFVNQTDAGDNHISSTSPINKAHNIFSKSHANPVKSTTEMSTTLNYMTKYGLLQNKCLSPDN